jgi:hypothetical protein
MMDERAGGQVAFEPRLLYQKANEPSIRIAGPNVGAHGEEATELLQIEHVGFTPPLDTDFLLPHFPLAATVAIRCIAPEPSLPNIDLWVSLAERQEHLSEIRLTRIRMHDEIVVFKGCLLPPRPGLFTVSVQMRCARQTFPLHQQRVRIAEPRPHEPWTLGPMVHWVDDGLYLGNAAAAANPKAAGNIGILQSHGIRAVLNVAEERDPEPRLLGSGIEYHQIPFRDLSHNPMEAERIADAIDWIHEQVSRKRALMVHCHAGIGRSGSIAVAYMMLYRQPRQHFDEVVETIQSRLRSKGHAICPHLDLPETIDRLRDARLKQAGAGGRVGESATRIISVGFHSLALGPGEQALVPCAGTLHQVHIGSPIQLRVKVQYKGIAPRGVQAFTNLNRDGPGFETVPMAPIEDDETVFEAVLTPSRRGQSFWLTAFATPRQYDHRLKAVWVAQDVHVGVS